MKRPPLIDWTPYFQAEEFLRTELISPEEAELLGKYRTAVAGRMFDDALEYLVALGDLQGCSNPYWQALERAAFPSPPRLRNHDKCEQGRVDALKDYIQRRARGLD